MLDKFRDECGVVAVHGHPEAANLAYLGLHALLGGDHDTLFELLRHTTVDCLADAGGHRFLHGGLHRLLDAGLYPVVDSGSHRFFYTLFDGGFNAVRHRLGHGLFHGELNRFLDTVLDGVGDGFVDALIDAILDLFLYQLFEEAGQIE